ncbi:uncharacterized protein LOC115631351 [Scaptodrosophila lebanonensis]|uniref:Uncharacterized protein LOC115631351 n=1 Tax=Drosophila lebanonensis TaxID=7225 RepID=A0A6J2U9R1_DROLE|nr:uncharacterized protein LOC115631351 [Scaptodrosophila lebanonensis]
MTLRLISILSMALLIVLPAQLDAFITQNAGCHHNGTWFADKSLVPTMEKCLNCQCNKKTLVCRLKVCPEMPMPPPRGCVVVQKRNTCCPYLSCARLDAFYKIPTKRRIIAYLDHYERESIDRVVNDNMLQRRSDDSEVDLFVCVKNGTVYKSGSAMSSSNLCTYCYCIGGTEKCVKPKCMLPVEGCKPIFVDSTCCPVRYDCSTKTSGKSSQEVRYRKNSNKHFQRMSQRLQRNRGCTVGAQFYAEGQKMKSDVDRPCDICFCIRGTRRCAPKKCAPALKNCIPVVPKGQCCPSSYDCGSQRDYRRSQNSRQFNLYNLLFGKNEKEGASTGTNGMAEHYPQDRHPTEASVGDAPQASSEKSILDTLREGLEFIDGNNNQMLADNLDLLALQGTPTPSTEMPATAGSSSNVRREEASSTTALSFLDLLLGPSTESVNSVEQTTTTSQKPLSWMDILLGPDEDDQQAASLEASDSSTESATTPANSIKRIADDFDEQLASGEIAVGELPAEAQQIVLTNSYGTGFQKPKNATLPPQPINPKQPASLINAFLEGFSDMLNEPSNGTTTTTTTSTTTTTTTTSKPPLTRPPPMFRPLPSTKPHVRINSKLANLTVTPPMVTTRYGQPVTYKPLPTKNHKQSTTSTARPTTTTTTTTSTTLKPKPKTTRRTTTPPLLIKTNPSILESEPLDTQTPTLPPSLPNLKIIPFLPTDAVNTSPKHTEQNYNYYQSKPLHASASDKIDAIYDDTLYEEAALYPALTSAQPIQQQQPTHDQAAYKYKFKIEGPDAPPEPVISLGGKYEGSAAFVKYDFDEKMPIRNGFSPPKQTEGGFMPKEPLVIDGEVLQDHVTQNVLHNLAERYQVTPHIIDITTPDEGNNTTVVEITTPDPFKDVIHTETPPNLHTLIEDKEHNKSIERIESSTSRNHNLTAFDKSEISKLDKLLDELLGVESSTVPAFKTLPEKKKQQQQSGELSATIATTTTTTTTTSSTVHPFLMSPFDKLPFMDTSYEVKPHMLQPQQQQQQQQQQLQLAEQEQQPQQFIHYQHAHLGHTGAAAAASGASGPSGGGGGGGGGVGDALNNLIDPTGMLKLAGCNIYGRMYRVGRIIVELSSQCLECKCTEVGVKCGPLDC